MMSTEANPLSALMAERDMTPEALAVEIEKATNKGVRISAESVKNWMAGRNKPGAATQHLIAMILKRPIAKLFPQD